MREFKSSATYSFNCLFMNARGLLLKTGKVAL